MIRNRFQEIDDICIDTLCESGILLWNYTESSKEITFFGRRNIELFFGSSVDRFAMSWNDFLDLSVHPEDRVNIEQELIRGLDTSNGFTAVFRIKYSEKDQWEWINISGKVAPKDSATKKIGGIIRILPFMADNRAISVLPQDKSPLLTAADNAADNTEISKLDPLNSNYQLKIIFDALPLSCLFLNLDGTVWGCNTAATQFFGTNTLTNSSQRLTALSPKFQPNGRYSEELITEKLAEVTKNGRIVFDWLHQKSDGEQIPTKITLVRMKQEDHDIVVGYIQDLRELKQIQGERDQERVLLRNILNSSPVCFVIIDTEDRITFVTPFTTDFLGINTGDTFSDYLVDQKIRKLLSKELEQNGLVNWHPVTMKTSNGIIKEILANMFFIDYYGTKAVMVWLIDVTEIRQVEIELRLARDAAEASVRAKSEFLANMSHEIRTPMNAILGMANLTLRTELLPKQREYIEALEQSARILLRIINDILDFSKIEAGRMMMEYHEFSLNEVIDDLDALVAESANKKQLTLSFELAKGVPIHLMGDSIRLRQVLVNLVGNAIKFTSEGSVVVFIDVVEQDGLSVLLRFLVRDSGIGITPAQKRLLFRPFSQADTSTTRKYGGTGLGLAISKSIVTMMKGEIDCESQPGQGTTFTFTARFGLPLEGDLLEDFSEIRTDVLLLGDCGGSLATIRNYLELLKCKVVAQYEVLDDFENFLNSDRMGEIDFIIFDFDDLEHKGLPMYMSFQSRDLSTIPLLVFSNHPDLDRFQKEQKILNSIQQIQKPIIASDLFNILMLVTSEKKRAMIEAKKKPHSQGETRHSAVSFVLPESIRGAKILLAEDNRINQMVATEMLKMEGFNVDVAVNGRIALEMIRGNHYDLVLMDIQMPEMDGLEATKIIRSDPQFSGLPILAMTAHAMTGDRELSIEAGMNDHITKPIDPALLFNTLAKWIRKS
ncbi:MAG: response regulator [Planctomycetaceae bacterium]|jgi:signal transduction histidine kinase/response regulator RpfG family c-di-GMP phosphodiesterase|nr:response regulator [Planctomycetaceae bacterium]